MSLKISFSWKRCFKWLIWGIICVLVLVFFIRVATFENFYYSSKEGSERATVEDAGVISVEEELIEEKPTEEEVHVYTVAPNRPRYLSIPKLGVTNARILAMGQNSKGELDTPRNIFDVGWFQNSGLPGQGGTLVIDGHNGGPHVHGVFKELPRLASGDIIRIERGDGVIYEYEVVENVAVLLADANNYMSVAFKSPVSGKESVTLISCTGEWSQVQGTYLSRQFTRAVLINN